MANADKENKMEGRRNCIAIDECETSEHAFKWYVENYHRPEDKVMLIHVHRMPQLPAMGLMGGTIGMSESYQSMINSSIRTSQGTLSKFEKMCKDNKIECEKKLVDDFHSPGHMICSTVKELNGDVVVTGQRGLGAVGRVLMGSTSDYVLHHAHVPVIVIPPEQKK